MRRITQSDLQKLLHKRELWLVCCWILGIGFGFFSARSASAMVAPMIRDAAAGTPYFWSTLIAVFLPFLISAFAASVSRSFLLPISFFKAYSFSFCAVGVGLAYGSSGWLIRCLFMFSDLILIPILLFYWQRLLSGKAYGRGDLIFCLIVCFMVGAIDRFFVSPFLVSLI